MMLPTVCQVVSLITASPAPAGLSIAIEPFPPPDQTPMDVFCDRPITLQLTLTSIPGEKPVISARLYQLGGVMAMPIGGPQILPPPATPDEHGRFRMQQIVHFPTVERPTDFVWRVSARDAEDTTSVTAQVHVHAYPPDILAPLRRWAARHPLVVLDETGSLRSFLTAQGVAFVHAEDHTQPCSYLPGTSTSEAVTVLAHQSTRQTIATLLNCCADSAASVHVIVLHETRSSLPTVIVKQGPCGHLIDVRLHLIDRLPDDPRARGSSGEFGVHNT